MIFLSTRQEHLCNFCVVRGWCQAKLCKSIYKTYGMHCFGLTLLATVKWDCLEKLHCHLSPAGVVFQFRS